MSGCCHFVVITIDVPDSMLSSEMYIAFDLPEQTRVNEPGRELAIFHCTDEETEAQVNNLWESPGGPTPKLTLCLRASSSPG